MATRYSNFRPSANENRRWSNVGRRATLPAATALCVLVSAFLTPVRRLEAQVAVQGEEVRELERKLRDPDEAVREFAAERLGDLGPVASSAATSLLQAAEDINMNVRAKAIWSHLRVSGVGDPSIPFVTYHNGIELPSASILEGFGPEQAAAVVPLLLDLLAADCDADPDRLDRDDLPTESLIHVSLPAPTVVPALIERLGNERAKVRTASAEQLLRLGPSAKEAEPALKVRLHDPDPACAAACAAALGAMDPDNDEFLAVLKSLLRSQDSQVRQRVAAYLWMLGPVAGEASDDLVAYLCDLQRQMHFPYYDLNALKRIGPPAVSALDRTLKQAVVDHERASPAPRAQREWLRNLGYTLTAKLHSALSDSDRGPTGTYGQHSLDTGPLQKMTQSIKICILELGWEMASILVRPEPRYMIPSWLGTLGPPAAPAVPTLIAVVKHFGYEDYWPQYFAIQTLGIIGKDAAPAVPHLLPFLDSDDAFIRGAALQALRKIGVSGESVRARLRPFLKSGDQHERAEAACLLARSGEPVDRILPSLIEVAAEGYSRSPFVELRKELLGSMASLGPAAVPQLIVALQSDDSNVREVAAEALGKIGPKASDAVPYLIPLLDTEISWDAAAESLGEIGPKAHAAIPNLVETLESFVGSAAAEPAEATDSTNDEASAESAEYDGDRYWDPNASIYTAFLHALGGIGQQARVAAPTVLKLTHSDDPEIRHVATKTLAQVDPINPALPGLMRRWLAEWEHKSVAADIDTVWDFDAVFDEFVDALPRMGPRAKSLLPRLERLMMTAPLVHPKVRCYAAYTLAKFQSHREQAENYLKRVRRAGLSDDFETINLADTLLQRLEGVEQSWTHLHAPHGVGP